MTITRAQLVAMAADELGIASVGQTLAVEDQEKIDEKINPLLGNLSARGVIYVPDADAIPESIQEPLSILLAQACAVTFGKPRDLALRDRMEDELRVIARRAPAPNKYLRADDALQNGSHLSYSRWLNGN
jgi:hypothetical protein